MRWAANVAIGLACALGALAPACGDFQVHVSADAEAAGNGTAGSPYLSSTQARDGIPLARKLGKIKPDEAVTVLIASGTYRLNSSFEIAEQDGGVPNGPVVYRGLKHGQVRIHGGRSIVERNAAAAAIMHKHGVAINDLFIFITPHLAEVQPPNDVHFTGKGYEMLGQQVAEAVMAAVKEP